MIPNISLERTVRDKLPSSYISARGTQLSRWAP